MRSGLRFILPIVLAVVCMLGAASLSKTSQQVKEQQLLDRVRPPQDIKHLTFGFYELMADSLWISVLQNIGYCEEKIAENRCRGESWLYHMLNAIMDLSPKFRIAHAIGPLALSVIISDIEGASRLFDKAVQHFPNDWPILYRAAYQAMVEEKDNAKAADLVHRAAVNGAPQWLYSLAAHLYKESGQQAFIESMLKELEEQKIEPEIIERVRKRLKKANK